MKLVEKLLGKRYIKSYNFDDKKIAMQALTKSELDEVLLKVSRITTTDNNLLFLAKYKLFTVARSIVSIDEIPVAKTIDVEEYIDRGYSQEESVEIVLGKLSSSIIDILYEFYVDVTELQRKEVDSLKNSLRGPSREQSGKSVKHSEKLPKN